MGNGNTPQHSVRMDFVLWDAYRQHRESIESNASEGLRNHAATELHRAGKLPPGFEEYVSPGVPA